MDIEQKKWVTQDYTTKDMNAYIRHDYDHKGGSDDSEGDGNGDLETVYITLQYAPINATVSQTSSGECLNIIG